MFIQYKTAHADTLMDTEGNYSWWKFNFVTSHFSPSFPNRKFSKIWENYVHTTYKLYPFNVFAPRKIMEEVCPKTNSYLSRQHLLHSLLSWLGVAKINKKFVLWHTFYLISLCGNSFFLGFGNYFFCKWKGQKVQFAKFECRKSWFSYTLCWLFCWCYLPRDLNICELTQFYFSNFAWSGQIFFTIFEIFLFQRSKSE